MRARLHERAADPRVREAVFLSTPDMYENVWAAYTSRPLRPANAKTRRVERQVYTYLQRLCAKNETASFFGPMGYGTAAEDAIFELVSNPRPARRVFFAFWGVEELIRKLPGVTSIRRASTRATPRTSRRKWACEGAVYH